MQRSRGCGPTGVGLVSGAPGTAKEQERGTASKRRAAYMQTAMRGVRQRANSKEDSASATPQVRYRGYALSTKERNVL